MKDAAHLLRLAALFVVVLAIFLIVRAAVVPATFGQYGHFRGSALEEIRSRPIAFAGREACGACHDAEATALKSGKHAGVGCEACHGPLAKHADGSMESKPALPDTLVLCARCHEKIAAKPKNFPQVDSREHSNGEACKTCHNPHTPKIGG